eukprot:Em0013g769a
MEPGLGKARTQILSKQLESKGGATEQRLSGTVTHVLVGNNVKLSRVLKILEAESLPAGVLAMRADWLSNCLVKGCKLDHSPYLVPNDDTVDPRPQDYLCRSQAPDTAESPAPKSTTAHTSGGRPAPSRSGGNSSCTRSGDDIIGDGQRPVFATDWNEQHDHHKHTHLSHLYHCHNQHHHHCHGADLTDIAEVSCHQQGRGEITQTKLTNNTNQLEGQYFGNIARKWKSSGAKTSSAAGLADSDSDYVASTDDEKDGEEGEGEATRGPEGSDDQSTEEENQWVILYALKFALKD